MKSKMVVVAAVAVSCLWPQGLAEWAVSGTISVRSGPVKGLYVHAAGPERRRTVTDSSGRYTLRGRQSGVYTVSVEASERTSAPRSRTLTLTSGQTVNRFDFVVPQGGTISGRVAERSGQPVGGMFVHAYERTSEGRHSRLVNRGTTLADDRGAYRIPRLPPGNYVIGVQTRVQKLLQFRTAAQKAVESVAPAYPPVTFAPMGRLVDTAMVVELHDGEERSGVDITMEKEPAYCVTFRAQFSAAVTAEGMSVGVGVREQDGMKRAEVASSGAVIGEQLRTCGLPAGSYELSLTAMVKSPFQLVGRATRSFVISKEHVNVGDVVIGASPNIPGVVQVNDATDGARFPEGIRISLFGIARTSHLRASWPRCGVTAISCWQRSYWTNTVFRLRTFRRVTTSQRLARPAAT